MNDRSITVVAFLFGIAAVVSFGAGLNVGRQQHVDDYQTGWSAGYDAREQQVQDDNARFAGAGLCTLAAFSCETHYKKKDPHK